MFKKLAFICLFLLNFNAFLHADSSPQQAVETFLTTLRTMKFPIQEAAEHTQKVTQANSFLDLDAMGIQALGTHWQAASPEDQKNYLQLLWQLIEQVAYPRSAKFIGNYEITYPKVEPAGNGFQVYSIIKQQAEGLDAAVEYHVYQKEGQWKIDDIILDDVSITEDLKGQFDRIIQDSKFLGLLDKMRERLEKAKQENGAA